MDHKNSHNGKLHASGALVGFYIVIEKVSAAEQTEKYVRKTHYIYFVEVAFGELILSTP